MRLRALFAVAALALTGCDFLKSKLPKPPVIDWSALGLPQKNGNGVVIEISGSRLELSPTLDDALVRLGACTDAITWCYTPGEHELDACVAEVPACDATLNPSGCCPKACQDGYAAARAAGTDDLEAFDATFFRQPDCFPGVVALVGTTGVP